MHFLRTFPRPLLSLATAALIGACAADTTTQPLRRLQPGGDVTRATVENETRIPVAGAVTNPCNGEPMAFTGYVHATFHITADAAGGIHVGEHFNTQGIQGVGAITGTTFTGNEASHDEFNASYGAEETFERHFSIITHGPLPNFVLHVVEHFTFNANGELTVFFTDFSAECRG